MNEQKKLKDINKNHQNEMDTLTSIEQLIINLNKENVAKTEITIINKCQDNYYSFNIIIAQIIYICFKIQHKHFDVYLKILKEIENFEEKQNKNKILVIFTEFLLAKKTQESYYILNQMIKANLIKPTILQNKTNPYFIHYLTEKEIKKLILNDDIKQILGNFEELSKNDWELHKKLIDEGVNPNEIAKIIRNDEIDNLQEIASQPNFDFDQTIAPSLYERCSYINKKNVTLIDYAAFFGSIKCFKYLLMNGANVFNTVKYAIAGGNLEIFHLCEQNHSSFKNAYETVIKFHRNDIFKYLYENKIVPIKNIRLLGKKCILYHNYELLLYLKESGMKIKSDMINESAKLGNLFFTKCFLGTHLPNNILINSTESGNFELVKYILQQEGSNNIFQNEGQKSLIIAKKKRYTEIVKLLLGKEGIDINLKDKDGWTIFMYASKKDHADIVKFLLEQEGIDINAKDNYGNTALMIASSYPNVKTVKLLLEQEGIDINEKNNNGYTALIYASKNGHKDVVQLLLEKKGIDINAKDKDGYTALIWASRCNYIEIVKLLLEKEEIDINAKEELQYTALNWALEKRNIEISKLLLKQEKIDINAKNGIISE